MFWVTRILRVTALFAVSAVAVWSISFEASAATGASGGCWTATGNASATFCGYEMEGCDEITVCEGEEGCFTWSTSPVQCGGFGVCCTEPE